MLLPLCLFAANILAGGVDIVVSMAKSFYLCCHFIVANDPKKYLLISGE
jgi:hypothetical protein